MTTSRFALALAVSCLAAAPSGFAQQRGGGSAGASGSGSSGGGGTAVARGAADTSGGSGGGGGTYSEGASGGGTAARSGGAWSRATEARAVARGASGASSGAATGASSGIVTTNGGAGTAGPYARGREAAGVPAYSRASGSAIGQAVPRGSVPMRPTNNENLYGYSGAYGPYGPYGYGYGFYGYPAYGYGYGSSLFGPLGYYGDVGLYGGFGGGYGLYDDYAYDAIGSTYSDVGVGYDPYASSSNEVFVPTDHGSSSSSGASRDTSNMGALRLDVYPLKASVYVDGKNVGLVKQYDSAFQKLRLPAGAHEVQLKADGYEPVTFHVRIEAGKTEVYRGDMEKPRR